MFGRKKKEDWLVLSVNSKYFKLVPESNMSDTDRFCGVVIRTKNYEFAETACRLLTIFQDRLDLSEDKILKEISKMDLSNRLTTGEMTVKVNDNCLIRSNIQQEDPDTFYAVQGHFPHITVSKYYKECEDKYNYCLRQEEGNLSLLPKNICFNNKTDAVLYQNELIQQATQESNKTKKVK